MVSLDLHGLNWQNNEGRSLTVRCLIKGLRTKKKWDQTPNIRVCKQHLDCLWQLSINRVINKLTTAGKPIGSQAVAVRCLIRTADNVSMIQDMICSQDDAPCIHKNPREIQEQY